MAGEGNPRFQFRVPAGVAQILNTMAESGVTVQDAVTAMANAWVQYQEIESNRGAPEKFLAALKNFGVFAPTSAIDLDSLREEIRKSAMLEAMGQVLKETEDALLVGITAAMVILDNESGSIIDPEVVESMMFRWFRLYGEQVRKVLARSARMRDALCRCTGRLSGESSQGAHYLGRILHGDFPAVEA